jgi:tRNA-modifying protein YgfZ
MTIGFRAHSWDGIEAVGSEAASWLGGIVTGEVPGALDGGATWSLLLSKQGKIQGELVLTRPSEVSVAINVRGGDAAAVRAALDHYLVMEDVELGDVKRASWAILVSAELDFVRQCLVDRPRLSALAAPFGVANTVLVRSELGSSDSGQAGSDQEDLRAILAEFADELSPSAWDDARVGLGLPEFGIDYDAADNPHQASLERRAVSWKKGCYLGQEVVFMQDARGKVKRRLVRLVPGESARLAPGDVVTTAEGEEVGRLTTVGVGRALARINAPHFEAGRLSVGGVPVAIEALDLGLFGRVEPADKLGQ